MPTKVYIQEQWPPTYVRRPVPQVGDYFWAAFDGRPRALWVRVYSPNEKDVKLVYLRDPSKTFSFISEAAWTWRYETEIVPAVTIKVEDNKVTNNG